MATVKNYEITQPPTSGEVETSVLDAIRDRINPKFGVKLTGFEVGPTDVHEENVEFRVISVGQQRDGSLRVLGQTAANEMLNIATSSDPIESATMAKIIAD